MYMLICAIEILNIIIIIIIIINKPEIEENTCSRCQARESAWEQVTIGFDFASHWLRRWRVVCCPVTERNKAKPKLT